MKKYHVTRDGDKIKIRDLELSHLKNILRWIDRKAAEGLTVISGGGCSAEDIWFDEDTYFGEEARRMLDYYDYKNELNRRKFI